MHCTLSNIHKLHVTLDLNGNILLQVERISLYAQREHYILTQIKSLFTVQADRNIGHCQNNIGLLLGQNCFQYPSCTIFIISPFTFWILFTINFLSGVNLLKKNMNT